MIDEHEQPSGAYDHEYENVAEEEIPDRRGTLRVAVWAVSAVIALVMVALPVIRVIDWGDGDDDTDSSASEARAFVATRFTSDALVRLSPTAAARWAIPSLRDEIESIVSDLQQRPAADLRGAAVSVARVECDDGTDSDSECFHAWVRQPGAADLIRIAFVVSIVNGDARVIEIERINAV